MDIPVLFDDDSEGEFVVEMCCTDCAFTQYGISRTQFEKIVEMTKANEPIRLSRKVQTRQHFLEWMKTSL